MGLTPAAVREYVANGHRILVQSGAGFGIGADDAAYRQAGATIVSDAKDIFAKAEMIVKVKEPQISEWEMLREGQILFTFLHLAPDPEQTNGLLRSGVTSVAYETVTEGHGLPLLAPMSEVAGRLTFEAKPRPSMVRAKVPCTSSQARTQREHAMHFDGSKSK